MPLKRVLRSNGKCLGLDKENSNADAVLQSLPIVEMTKEEVSVLQEEQEKLLGTDPKKCWFWLKTKMTNLKKRILLIRPNRIFNHGWYASSCHSSRNIF